MPKAVTPVSPQLEQDWLLIRQGLARLVSYVTPYAKVYDRWPLKFELGATAELLKSTSVQDGGRIHAWIIGVQSAIPNTDRVGGTAIFWDLTIRVWGFIGYQYGVDSDNPQNTLETECRKLSQIVFMNRDHLTLDNTQALKEVGFLEFPEIEAHGFGRDDIIVAQGEVMIKLKEVL
jgi:hypothetical protein